MFCSQDGWVKLEPLFIGIIWEEIINLSPPVVSVAGLFPATVQQHPVLVSVPAHVLSLLETNNLVTALKWCRAQLLLGKYILIAEFIVAVSYYL